MKEYAEKNLGKLITFNDVGKDMHGMVVGYRNTLLIVQLDNKYLGWASTDREDKILLPQENPGYWYVRLSEIV